MAGKEKEPMAQKPDTDRNAELADLAFRGAATTAQPTEGKTLPRHSGRTHDLGGSVEAVCVAPWHVLKGETLFRGDHVLTTASAVDSTAALVRV